MERFWFLSTYKKCILAALLAMSILFLVVYGVIYSRVGFLYMDEIFVPEVVDGNTVYSGVLLGTECHFTVTPDRTVTFRRGNRTFGPFTVREDPTAIPKSHDLRKHMTGYEVREGDTILFRGGMLSLVGAYPWLTNEDGTDAALQIADYSSNGGIVYDSHGNVKDPMKPSVSTIIQLVNGPELTRKGQWPMWFLGVFFSLIGAVSILFEEEIFYWRLSFQIRNAERAEPTEWEIFGRHVGMAVLTVLVFVLYMKGLQ